MRDKILEAIEYMRNNTEKGISIEELSSMQGYSKYHFSREFKKEIGVSPNEYWAALRIEKMYLELKSNHSVLQSHLKAGYLSSGTFSNMFLENTGMTPSTFRKNINEFYKIMHKQEYTDHKTYSHYDFDKDDYRVLQKYHLEVNVETPPDFEGTIFVGLFTKPIPNHTPIVGKAMFKARSCIIDRIPNGSYYVLVCGIFKNSNPIDYFHLDKALRDIEREPIIFPLEKDETIYLKLREKQVDDPPIANNPVRLLLEVMKNSKLE